MNRHEEKLGFKTLDHSLLDQLANVLTRTGNGSRDRIMTTLRDFLCDVPPRPIVTRNVVFAIRQGSEDDLMDWLSDVRDDGAPFLEWKFGKAEKRMSVAEASAYFEAPPERFEEAQAVARLREESDAQHFVVLCHEECSDVPAFPMYVIAANAEDAEATGMRCFRSLESTPEDVRVMCDLVVKVPGPPLEFWTGQDADPVKPVPVRESDFRAIPGDLLTEPAESASVWKPLSVWDNHPDFTYTDWKAEIASDDTRQSYIDWVNSKLQERGHG